MAKGFYFSLDAALAIALLALFLVSYSFLSSQISNDTSTQLVLKKQANDLLIVLDKTGELDTLNSTLLEIAINETVPASVNWSLEIAYYSYSGGFSSQGTVTAGSSGYPNMTTIVSGRREFVITNGTGPFYGVARLWVWPK